MELNSLSDVLVEELGGLYSAEQQLIAALPKMAAAAHSYDLREAFEAHLKKPTVTSNGSTRCSLRWDRVRAHKAVQSHGGLVDDGDEITQASGDSVAIDAALIGAAQRVEHYEIASYGTARALAGELGLDTVSSLLDETLDEEEKTNRTLTKLAAGGFLSSGMNCLAATRAGNDSAETDEPDPNLVPNPARKRPRGHPRTTPPGCIQQTPRLRRATPPPG